MTKDSEQIEKKVLNFGKQIFKEIDKEKPGSFNKDAIAGKLMSWSMSKPSFKVNLFRLVDVLPSLRSSSSIAKHVVEYLAEPAKEISGLAAWGISSSATGIRSKISSFAVKKSVNEMAKMFIAGETPKEAIKKLKLARKNKLVFTVDLLGEYSLNEKEAVAYLDRYLEAIKVLGEEFNLINYNEPIVKGHKLSNSRACVSVKLSALYSQCSVLNYEKSVEILGERLSQIARKAKENNVQIYVDAEDIEHNNIIYDTYKKVFSSTEFEDVMYPGIVLQAYAKNAILRIKDLLEFAKNRGNPIAIRLVKGAYWDHEKASANQNQWENPLFEIKEDSDANYELCSKLLLENTDICMPAFGSHNIRSLSYACMLAEELNIPKTDFELQMLYGMAEPIAKAYANQNYLVRLYVPLGEMIPGMGYLVRRLLENTSNESFLKHTFTNDSQVSDLLRKPNFSNQDLIKGSNE